MSVFNIVTDFAAFLIQKAGTIFSPQTVDPALPSGVVAEWYRGDLHKWRYVDDQGAVHNVAAEDYVGANFDAIGADETLSASGAVGTTRTSRFDLATANANLAMALANGTRVGQRKALVNMSASANRATTITPATMAEGLTHVTLTAKLDAAELEWQANGWKVVMLSGTAAAA
jgi:hypothetical protein